MRNRWWVVLAVGLLACGDDPPPQCVPGTAQECACTDGTTGSQTCNAAGSFDPCTCDGVDAGDPGDASTQDTGGADAPEGEDAGVDAPPVCPDGVVSGDEQCDDDNDVPGDGCTGCVVDEGWLCDDGSPSVCAPECGDGVLLGDEECDDGNDDPDDGCDECAITEGWVCDEAEPSTCATSCEAPPAETLVFAAITPRMGASLWEFDDEVGLAAGDARCQALGADHVCSYRELLLADARGRLESVPPDTEIYLRRVEETVTTRTGGTSAPGAGGRCVDWLYRTGHAADGEYARLNFRDPSGNAVVVGNHSFYFDQDATFSGDPADGHAGSGVDDGGACGGTDRAVACCYPCGLPEEPHDPCAGERFTDRTGVRRVGLTRPLTGPVCLQISVGTQVTLPMGSTSARYRDHVFGGTFDPDTGEMRVDASSPIQACPAGGDIPPHVSSDPCEITWTFSEPGSFPFFLVGDPLRQNGVIEVVP